MSDLYIITDTSPEKKYVPKNKPGIHDCQYIFKSGQRKLLASEINFLTRYSHMSNTIIYAGAAPGMHLNILMMMFPSITNWILYDPNAIKVSNLNDSIEVMVINEYFTEEEASKYAGDNALFISDIRSYDSNTGKVPVTKANETIKRDMELQKRLVQAGQFAMSYLKFRLPWEEGQTHYFKGILYLTPWLGEYSPELRLATNGKEFRDYDNTKLDNQMYHYNTVTRRTRHPFMEKLGLKHLYQDQILELCIVKDYFHNIKDIDYDEVEIEASRFINKHCDNIKASPHLS
jgi:cap2 methyltransferase